MKIRKCAAISLLLLTSFVASGVTPAKSQLESMYDKAFNAFDKANYEEALTALDAIDKRQPDLAESLNLRGVVYMRQGKYDKAEAALRKALALEPKFWNASFNLAEIPFLKKDWTEARNRFEALIAGESEGMQPETNQLIQYKVLLTFVLQGKDNMVDWILNKFELSKDSPALYYANAAIALQHGNQKEADEWLAGAEKNFSAPLNKLYAESLYEVGWKQKPAGESRAALEITSTAERAERLKGEAKANFEKAARAFQQRNFEGALKLLDLVEAATPNDPAAENLRGEVLMEQKKYDQAEVVLRKAFTANPKFREAQYNLAQIAFKKGDYAEARNRFEDLYGETSGDEKNQASQLIKFKIFLTLLLEGKSKEAQQMMDQFKFTGDTPALYYAHAASEFQQSNTAEGIDWVTSARKIYSPALNIVFADSLYDLGWLQKAPGSQPPAASALAQADAQPPTESKPAMRLGQAESVRPQEPVVEGAPATEGTPAPAPTVAMASPASPTAGSTPAPAQPAASPVVAQKAPGAPAAIGSSPVEETGAAPGGIAEMASRISEPRTLVVGLLLLGGILILAWLVFQQVRRHASPVVLYNSSAPLTEPPFSRKESDLAEDRRAGRDLVSTGPPKLSLNLQASEPAVRAAVFPSGAITARGAVPGVAEPASASPESGKEELPKTAVPAPAIPAVVSAAESKVEPPKPESEAPKPEIQKPEEKIAVAPVPGVPEFVPAPESILEPIAAKEPTEEPAVAAAPVPAESDLEREEIIPGWAAAASVPEEEPSVWMEEEPVGQGQPIPQLTTALSGEPIISELTQPEPDSPLELIEPGASVAIPIAGHRPVYSSIETPSFASKIITTEPIRPQPTIPVTMPETTITPASAPTFRAPQSPTMSVQQPAGGMHTAVQLTFSLEIASMQLTPTFKMSGLQLKPTSKVVSMRLAPSQDPQPPMNLQVTFEVAKIELSNGAIASVRLAPSAQQKPAVLTSPSFAISGLELVGQGAAPVQLTPSHQEQASVQLTAEFQISAIEFTPLFEIATIVLNANSKKVSMQLPGAGPSSIDNAPVFEIENVQLGPGNELGLIQVTPGRGA